MGLCAAAVRCRCVVSGLQALVVLAAGWLIVGLVYVSAADVFGAADRRLRAMLAEDEQDGDER